MILLRFVARELLTSWLVISLVLGFIMLGSSLTETLYQIAQGAIPKEGAAVVLGVEMLSLWRVVMPLSSALATATTLTRLYASSEMAGMLASGYGGFKLAWPLAVAFAPVALIGVYISLVGLPTLAKSKLALMSAAGPATVVGKIQAQTLQPLGSGVLVYAEEVSDNGMSELFVFQKDRNQGTTIEVAKRASVEAVADGVQLVLEDGMVMALDGRSINTIEYAEHRGLLKQWVSMKGQKLDEFTVFELDDSPEHRLAFHSRISLPLAGLLLPFFIYSVVVIRPRESSIKPALWAVLGYFAIGNVAVALMEQPIALDYPMVVYTPFVGVFLLSLLLLWRKEGRV
ncbi:MAG: LptF/LptG family permease [Gammaproteobacteria bacterium]|nr:LptF/LptG family permease [Gammaproteobacteria bacterium]